MIPRFKPFLGQEELTALLSGLNRRPQDAVTQFEMEFAQAFETRHALVFPYGRSALWTFFKAVGLEGAEIIMPAYTCVVVAHAIVLSGNIPRFVDISLSDYTMELDQVQAAITERTRAIIPTHLFGYPMNVDWLNEMVRAAEARYGHKIWIIQDCAHAFGARWQGRLVGNAGDAALFGLNISKLMTSIFGGLLTTNDAELADRLRAWRDRYFIQPGITKTWRRSLYLLAIYPAFNETLYGLVYWLQEETPLLNRLTKAYHLDEQIHFPPDYQEQMSAIEARIGLTQLRKYPVIVQRRQAHAHAYAAQLQDVPGLDLPPLIEGATYSHYVVRVPDRMSLLKALQRKGVQLGQLIDYSIPHMAAYRGYTNSQDFPRAWWCSQHTINLPVHAHLQAAQRDQIVRWLIAAAESVTKKEERLTQPEIKPQAHSPLR